MGDDEWAEHFLTAFWAAKRAMATASEAAYSRHGVRAGQQFILHCLWDNDGLAPGEIARRLGLATPTVTRAATRMEAAGLLRREPHPTDARLVRLRLTERGRELRTIMGKEMDTLRERALAGLSPRERAEFARLLDTMQRNLGAPEHHGTVRARSEAQRSTAAANEVLQ